MAEGNIPNTSEFSSLQKSVEQLNDLKWGSTTRNSWKNFCKVYRTEEKSTAAKDELDDLTTCYICDDTYKDPMILPCVHTFCLTCLQVIGSHTFKDPDDQMPCPLCREEFTIPEDGFAALKKNFLVVRLIDIATTKQEASVRPTKQRTSSFCDIHMDENICLYCFECNEVVCLVCVREWHPRHSMSDLSRAADSLRSQLESDVSTANCCMSDALEKKESLRDNRSAVLEKIQLFKTEVDKVRFDLKALIDRHDSLISADSLLQNLESRQEQQLEDIELKQKELDKHLDCLNNFVICCAMRASNDGHDNLFCKMASELKKQIVELKQRNESIVEGQLNSREIVFKKPVPTALEIYETKNIIGVVKGKIDYSVKPERVTRIGANSNAVFEGCIISGMAVSYNDVFVVYENNPAVRIYDAETKKFTTQMTVEDLVSEVDLRDCVSADGNVYIVNGITCEIIRINKNRDLIKWSTGDDSGRLSVSAESTLVATCYETGALREYSLRGTLLQEIELCSTIVHPQHAVKLGNGHFVVSYGSYKEVSSFDEAFNSYNDAVKGVCVVDDFGAITKSYDNCLSGFGTQSLLLAPTCLAVDENGNILILDGCKYGCRILLLGPELEFKRELLTEEDGLRRSVAMQLVEESSQLYIADNDWETCDVYDSEVFVFSVT